MKPAEQEQLDIPPTEVLPGGQERQVCVPEVGA
jgi:hypothetical protein